jgi:hypothetical protein
LKDAGYRLSLGGWAGKNDRDRLEALPDFLRTEPRNLSANEVTNLVLQHKDAKTALITQGFDSRGRASIGEAGGIPRFSGAILFEAAAVSKASDCWTRRKGLDLHERHHEEST